MELRVVIHEDIYKELARILSYYGNSISEQIEKFVEDRVFAERAMQIVTENIEADKKLRRQHPIKWLLKNIKAGECKSL